MMVTTPILGIQEYSIPYSQWIGLGEKLQENPIFNGKNHGFL